MSDANGLTGMPPEVKKAVDATFETMNKWRDEISSSTDRYSDQLFDRMSAAAKAAGWPDTMIEASRSQIQSISKMQTQMIDQFMDVWQQQIKSPGSMPNMPQFSQTNPFGIPGVPGMPGMPGMPGNMPMNPMQFWMQAAESWQKMMTGGR